VIDHLPGAAKVPAIHSDGDRRDLRLDACRGLALWFIFIDHIPDNALAWLTLRNYGFNSATLPILRPFRQLPSDHQPAVATAMLRMTVLD
jgi:hypothetical protein